LDINCGFEDNNSARCQTRCSARLSYVQPERGRRDTTDHPNFQYLIQDFDPIQWSSESRIYPIGSFRIALKYLYAMLRLQQLSYCIPNLGKTLSPLTCRRSSAELNRLEAVKLCDHISRHPAPVNWSWLEDRIALARVITVG